MPLKDLTDVPNSATQTDFMNSFENIKFVPIFFGYLTPYRRMLILAQA